MTMLNLIPGVKSLAVTPGFLKNKTLCYGTLVCDDRVSAALQTLPHSADGTKLTVTHGDTGEGYTLTVAADTIAIDAQGPAGAFYALQTLRQLFTHENVPCLVIEDSPDFPYRGFYQDITRGKVPTLATLKALVDRMAYYKLNSLQLYVEHTCQCEEYRDLWQQFGYLTNEEIRELDAYCKRNFIELIPSLATFGHLYELLNQEKYRHLRVDKAYDSPHFWRGRMAHHTIDPLHPDSIRLIRSLIDQYSPHFASDYFNICCDETFDLRLYADRGMDVGKVYVDFVRQIVAHVERRGKTVMMWADILLKHPETIDSLPEDVCFLNWDYRAQPPEEKILKFKNLGRRQIVCPGTGAWRGFCEDVEVAEQNICRMAQYGYRHGAIGVLNTNWGDYGNPCSLELAMYGMVLGAEKSWSVQTPVDEGFYRRVNHLLYGGEDGIRYLQAVSRLQKETPWLQFCHRYVDLRYGTDYCKTPFRDTTAVIAEANVLAEALRNQRWHKDEYRQELLLAAEGICLMAQLWEKTAGIPGEQFVDTRAWLDAYCQKWLQKNKPSELYRIAEMFTWLEES